MCGQFKNTCTKMKLFSQHLGEWSVGGGVGPGLTPCNPITWWTIGCDLNT